MKFCSDEQYHYNYGCKNTVQYTRRCMRIHHATATHTCPIHILHASIHAHTVPHPTPSTRQLHSMVPRLRHRALPRGADLRVQLTLLSEEVVQHDAAKGVSDDRDSASLSEELWVAPHELVVLTLEGYFQPIQ